MRVGILLFTSLTWALGMQQTVGMPAYWTFCSHQKKASYDNDLSFFFCMEVVLMQHIG